MESNRVPGVILGQGEALAVLSGAAALFFAEPSEARAQPVRDGRRRAEELRAGAKTDLSGRSREDWLAVSRWIGEAADHAFRAVEDALILGASDPALGPLAAGVAQSAACLGRALDQWGRREACQLELAQAKRLAAGTLHDWRRARDRGAAEPRVVASMKTGAVLQRLSDAAEGLAQAADRLAELLALADD